MAVSCACAAGPVHWHLGSLLSHCLLACRVKVSKLTAPDTMLVMVHPLSHQVLPGRFVENV